MPDSNEIIRSINQIYDRLNIIGSLRMHMFRVAAIGESIADHWTTSNHPINRSDIIAALLLHDLGNIVKFNFDEPKFWSDTRAEEVEYWKGIKRDTVERYGTQSDKAVTLAMAREVGAGERIMHLLSNMGFGNVAGVIASDDFDLKICLYADQRVGPSGVMPIIERFRDLRQRYGRGDNWIDDIAINLESQIFRNASILPSDITESSVQRYISRYLGKRQIVR
jgi:hypothetical protein